MMVPPPRRKSKRISGKKKRKNKKKKKKKSIIQRRIIGGRFGVDIPDRSMMNNDLSFKPQCYNEKKLQVLKNIQAKFNQMLLGIKSIFLTHNTLSITRIPFDYYITAICEVKREERIKLKRNIELVDFHELYSRIVDAVGRINNSNDTLNRRILFVFDLGEGYRFMSNYFYIYSGKKIAIKYCDEVINSFDTQYFSYKKGKRKRVSERKYNRVKRRRIEEKSVETLMMKRILSDEGIHLRTIDELHYDMKQKNRRILRNDIIDEFRRLKKKVVDIDRKKYEDYYFYTVRLKDDPNKVVSEEEKNIVLIDSNVYDESLNPNINNKREDKSNGFWGFEKNNELFDAWDYCNNATVDQTSRRINEALRQDRFENTQQFLVNQVVFLGDPIVTQKSFTISKVRLGKKNINGVVKYGYYIMKKMTHRTYIKNNLVFTQRDYLHKLHTTFINQKRYVCYVYDYYEYNGVDIRDILSRIDKSVVYIEVLLFLFQAFSHVFELNRMTCFVDYINLTNFFFNVDPNTYHLSNIVFSPDPCRHDRGANRDNNYENLIDLLEYFDDFFFNHEEDYEEIMRCLTLPNTWERMPNVTKCISGILERKRVEFIETGKAVGQLNKLKFPPNLVQTVFKMDNLKGKI